MADENKQNENAKVDLSELSKLQFATAWTPSSKPERSFAPRRDFKSDRREGDGRDFKKRDFSGKKFDKKFDKPRGFRKNDDGKAPSSEGRPFRKTFQKKFDKPKAPFNFTMEVLFYPEDAPFNKLAEIMKSSKRTYQLFDIAEIILEKPERFIVLAKNLPDANGETKPLYCAQPQNLPFEDEASAKAAAIEYRLGELFSKEKIEAEAPKGNFQVVNKCGITGALLGAPNWHRYNEFIREYHREHCPKASFESFCASIESVRDPEQIAAWLEQMKTREVYKLKTPAEGENDIFETREAAVNYISHKMGDELVKTYDQVRMKGVNAALMPFGRIRRNIEETWRKQKRFPIITANNLRGRLRRSGFAVYKRGSKGFAFVSVVKRKFLLEGDSLSETPQKILEFALANPGISASDLPYKFLGLAAPDSKPASKTLAEENKDVAAAQTAPEAAAAETAASEAAPAETEISEENKAKLLTVRSELLWLISEGYVVEYADSTIQANPFLPRPKDKSKAPSEENLGAADEPVLKEKAPVKEEEEDEAESEPEEAPEAPKLEETKAEEPAASAEAPEAESSPEAPAEEK